MLEARALQEGLSKLASMATTAAALELRVSAELQQFLKIAHRAHPTLQALLIDISCYQPRLVTDGTLAPHDLAWGT